MAAGNQRGDIREPVHILIWKYLSIWPLIEKFPNISSRLPLASNTRTHYAPIASLSCALECECVNKIYAGYTREDKSMD